MSRYNMFRLRVKGTEENCRKLAAAVYAYDGHTDDPYVAAQSGTAESCVLEVNGALRGDVFKYMFTLPEEGASLTDLSGALHLAVEIFAADPGDDFFEYYYCEKGELVKKCNLPQYVEDLEEYEIDEADHEKYKALDDGGYLLRAEYRPDAEWEWDDEEGDDVMVCRFVIEME